MTEHEMCGCHIPPRPMASHDQSTAEQIAAEFDALAAAGRLPSCPPWCTASHDSEIQRTISATHTNAADAVLISDDERILVMAFMETGQYAQPFEIWLWRYETDRGNGPIIRLSAEDATALADVLTTIRKTDKLAPLLRKAAGLAPTDDDPSQGDTQ